MRNFSSVACICIGKAVQKLVAEVHSVYLMWNRLVAGCGLLSNIDENKA